MYGGEDYSQRQLNNATDARLQAGSLFKVYALLAAVDDGISTLTRFPGPSPMYFTVEGESEPYEAQFADPARQELKRDLGQKSRRANVTDNLPLFEKYQFFTPGKLTAPLEVPMGCGN